MSSAVLHPSPRTDPPSFSRAAPSGSPDLPMAFKVYPPQVSISCMVPSQVSFSGSSFPLNLIHSSLVPPVGMSSTKESFFSFLEAGLSICSPLSAVFLLVISIRLAAGVSPMETTSKAKIFHGVPSSPFLHKTLLTCLSTGPVCI